MRYRYTRYTGEELEGVDLEDLISKLSDLLLSSGFNNPYDPQTASDQNVQDLHDAILEALLSGGMLPQETLERLLGDPADADSQSKLEQLIKQIIEAMSQRGYITTHPDLDSERMEREAGASGSGADLPPVKFEVTDKSLDFLGYRALRDLLGSMGKRDATTRATSPPASTPKPRPSPTSSAIR
jgi:Ca-activated chloride channel family protein